MAQFVKLTNGKLAPVALSTMNGVRVPVDVRTSTHSIADEAQLTFKSEVYAGEIMDTQVLFEGKPICWIAGSDIARFTKEMAALIEKFAI